MFDFNSIFDNVNIVPQLRWPFGKIGCDLTATLMFFIGCTSVYMLVAISLQRYYIIRRPFNIRKITQKTTLIVIGISCALGLTWSLLPLIGWSSFVLEGALTSCGPDFHSKTFNNLSFNITLFLTVFVIPFGTISVTSFKLYLKVMNFEIFYLKVSLLYINKTTRKIFMKVLFSYRRFGNVITIIKI